ncbi:MAG: hypothetical protein KBT53_04860 [Porticoccus sp.]|nr:hypothetical protein [Porticoccus sp.]
MSSTATLSSTTSATPSFTAPLVIADEQLTFQLTVTDDQGATDSDSVNVTVQDIAGPDTTPPITFSDLYL